MYVRACMFQRGSRAPLSLSHHLPDCFGAWHDVLKCSLGGEDSWRMQVTGHSGCGRRGDAGRERDKARSEHARPGMPVVTVIPMHYSSHPCSKLKPQQLSNELFLLHATRRLGSVSCFPCNRIAAAGGGFLTDQEWMGTCL